MISRLLRKNTSPARIAGFVLSNFIGLAIVIGAVMFYRDARSIWTDDDSFIRSDYMVVNKKVTASNTIGQTSTEFTDSEIADLEKQPWVRKVGQFSSNDYKVSASVRTGDRGMSTYMFFESIPDDFVDVPKSQWLYREGSDEVPIILSKDYLALYNFGFASSAGLPQVSEGIISSIPLTLQLTSEDGSRERLLNGRVAGFSNRLNTILVPQDFMDETNRTLGTGRQHNPSRLIVDVSSPGDVAISKYIEDHGLEVAGDKSASSAAFLLKLIVGIVIGVGGVITLLSLFVLMLSMALLMEKNRDKIHSLLMLGYDAGSVARPYEALVVWACSGAYLLAVGSAFLLRAFYLAPVRALGASPEFPWLALLCGLILTILIILANILSLRKRIKSSFRQ